MLFGIYFTTARFGLRINAVGGFASLVWPPTGIALAALVIFGYSMWPAVFAGALVVNYVTGAPILVALGIAAGNTLEAYVGSCMLKRFVNFDKSLNRQKDVVGLMIFAGLISTAISATIGVTSLFLGNLIIWPDVIPTFKAWWVGDILGNIIVAPLLFTWAAKPYVKLTLAKILEVLALAFFLAFTTNAVFGELSMATKFVIPPFPFIIFPFIIWAALRFEPKGSATAIFFVSAMAIYNTINGMGPFAQGELTERLSFLNSFLAIIAFTGMILASAIAERKIIEKDLLSAKEDAEAANRAKSAFLANMSHEIRTPLGAVLGFSDLVIDPDVSSSDKTNFVSIIKRNGELLSNIINDILDLSKVEAGKMEVFIREVSVSELLNDIKSILDLQAKSKGIALNIIIDENVPQIIKTDALRLRQILINIVGNAIKFTSRGQVEIKIQQKSDQDGKNILEFIVSDTGLGISPDQAVKLFEPFSQADVSSKRKFGGTGLGLALSKRLANLLGGNVILSQTNLNQGSTFIVTIDAGPLSELASASREKQKAQLPPTENLRLKGIKVLLAEDSSDNQVLISRFLKVEGAFVDVAVNGLEAFEKAQVHQYDIILMDLQMPVMDGYEATAKLRQQGYSGKILAITAHALSEERERALQNGFDEHLKKPIDRKTLIERVDFFARKSS